jgi:hypothetical protein
MASIQEVAGEDAQTVPALLCFAAVGIEDAQTESLWILLNRDRPKQEAIGANATVAVTQGLNSPLIGRKGSPSRVDHEVVIPKGVVFREIEVIRHGFVLEVRVGILRAGKPRQPQRRPT